MRTHIDVRILLVSAVASGQGKTTVTAALARKLVRQGLRVRVFKTGPDFLDPMLLERASGAPVYQAGSLKASYFHAYFPSCPAAVAALFLRGDSA